MSEERIFDKLDAMASDLAQVRQDVAILKKREQPSSPCRDYMSAIKTELAEKDSSLKHEMTALAGGLHKRVEKSVSKWTFGYFMTAICAVIGVLAGWLWELARGIK